MSESRARSRTGRNVAANLLLVLAGIVLPLAAVELFLMWDNRRPQLEPTRIELGGRQFRFFERPDALQDLRHALAVVGDSFTAGEACGDGRSYPSYLDRLVRQGGQDRRVVNLGMPGADPFMYLQLVEGLVASGRTPPLALVTLFSNDIELTCSVCAFLGRIRGDRAFAADEIARLEGLCRDCTRAQNASSAHYGAVRRAHTWLHKRAHVYALLREAAVGISMKLGYNIGWGRSAYPPLWQDHGSLEFRLLKFALAGMRDALHGADGARMMVVIYPDIENLRPENAYVGIYRRAEDELSRFLGVPVLSGYPAFIGNPAARHDMPYSLVDHHPSCQAHELFAKWVFGRLLQKGASPLP